MGDGVSYCLGRNTWLGYCWKFGQQSSVLGSAVLQREGRAEDIKSTQCIEETNTNLQINGYLPHTTDFIFINCTVSSTNRLHLLSTFILYTVSIIVGNIESNLKKVLVRHTRLVLYRLIVANIDLFMFISTKTNINLLIPLV